MTSFKYFFGAVNFGAVFWLSSGGVRNVVCYQGYQARKWSCIAGRISFLVAVVAVPRRC